MATAQARLLDVYQDEAARQNTFIYLNWPQNAPVWPRLLAKAGFIYQGDGLNVSCFSCGIRTSVEDWTRNVHPQKMHFKLNPDCEFIRSILKPEGGPATFNNPEKWQLNNFVEIEKDSSDLEVTPKASYLAYHDEGISIRDTIDSNTADGSQNYVKHEPMEFSSVVQESSADSGFSVQPESIVVCDSGPAGGNDSLVISGRSSFLSPIIQGTNSSSNARCSPLSVPSDTVLDRPSLEAPAPPEVMIFRHPDMETVSARMVTFSSWPLRAIQDPRFLATAGFFYTLDHDVVRCFCCDLGLSEWDTADDAWMEHARHSPNCWYLKRVKGQPYIDGVQKDWKKIYDPKFPNLIDESARIRTFSGWPNRIVRPTSIDIAKAGFFFTGRNDECRCHYCDGGLQHWEEGDNPWEQHAIYFPFCKFVIKMKGRDFINSAREQFEERGPSVDALIRESEETEAALTRDDVRERKLKEVLSKKEFKDLTSWGYSKNAIKMAAGEVFQELGNFDFTPEQVINKIIDLQERGEELPTEDSDTEETTPPKDPLLPAAEFMKQLEQEEPVEDANKVLEENKKLKERLLCWKCGKNEICMLFTPCGHRLTCEDCAKVIHHCLKCKKKVKKKYKTFLA